MHEGLVRTLYRDDEQLRQVVLDDSENKDCLVRLYFGQNHPVPRTLYATDDSMRNFPLYLDDARNVGLDVDTLAEEMARGLAVLHWHAGIDSQDTEFVLGCSSSSSPSPHNISAVFDRQDYYGDDDDGTTTLRDSDTGVHLWILDFDKATHIPSFSAADDDDEIVRKYLVAVTGNDPYFPHPRLDVDLWERFRTAYIRTSQVVLELRGGTRDEDAGVGRLPGVLIERWEEWAKENVDMVELDPFERTGEEREGGEEDEGWGDDDEEEDTSDNDEEDDNDTKVGTDDTGSRKHDTTEEESSDNETEE